MEISIIVLLMGVITTFLLFGLIAFGAKNRNERKDFERNLVSKTDALDNNSRETLEALQTQLLQQQKIIERLQNLETIVTSEAWDAIKDDQPQDVVNLFIEEEQPEEISPEKKAETMAKKVR